MRLLMTLLVGEPEGDIVEFDFVLRFGFFPKGGIGEGQMADCRACHVVSHAVGYHHAVILPTHLAGH